MEAVAPMVSCWTGPINSLVDKLAKLENPPELIKDLKQDLESLKALLDKFTGRGARDEQVKEWMKQARELVCDIEDWVDPKLETNLGELEKDKLEEFMAQIEEAREICTRYDLLSKAPTDQDLAGVAPIRVTIDHQLVLEEKTGLVAIADPKEELKKHLTDGQKKLKVVSIVGTGGLGKTTLAKEVHGELQREFECGAFVHVGRSPSTRTILINILHQIMPPEGSILAPSINEQDAIAKLWELLGKKRYLIVLDGVWSIRTWRVISCTLPDNNLGSRILTTVRVKDVAKSCCIRPSDVVYPMEVLDEVDSSSLFRISVGEGKKHVDSEKVSGVLKICGGIPLAIIVAAGLLPRNSAQLAQPKMLGRSVLSSRDKYSISEGMRKMLHMSFSDLSLPAKSCFMYLAVFPGEYTIKKDRLIRLWVGEGFIPRRDEESLWETGESCFKELVSRRLIQPVFNDDDGQAVGCTVHGVILDFIGSLSSTENFATTSAELSSGQFPCDTIRRFSLDCRINTDEADHTLKSSTVDLSRVRSLTAFGDVGGINDLSAFKLVRVLDLEDCKNLGTSLLEGITSFFLLRYLGLAGTSVTTRCLEQIGELQHLQTLDLRRTEVKELHTHISTLQKLVSLLGDGLCFSDANMPDLEELSTIDVTHSCISLTDVAELLARSRRLRILGVRISGAGVSDYPVGMIRLLDQIWRSNLESLVIDGDLHELDEWAPCSTIRRFQLTKCLPRVPDKWDSLDNLTHLDIRIGQIKEGDLFVLGKLRNLILLKLYSNGYDETGCIVRSGGFRSLEMIWLMCPNGGMGFKFAWEAMPKLRTVWLHFSAWETRLRYGTNGFDFGIQFPSSLAHVHVTIGCEGSTLTEVDAAELAIRDQISRNPINPSLALVRHGESFMRRYEASMSKSSGSQEEKEKTSSARGGASKAVLKPCPSP